MGFQLDGQSLARLNGVHTDLARVVQDCASHSTMPFAFGVTEGLRTPEQQKRDVAAGKSQTLDSRHLTGHAVDLAVFLLPSKHISWAWPPYFTLASAMREAALRIGIPVIWGGCWDRALNDLTPDMEVESALYVTRARARGQKGFLDGPHYELPRDRYP